MRYKRYFGVKVIKRVAPYIREIKLYKSITRVNFYSDARPNV